VPIVTNAIGSRPLILVAVSTITVAATLDVASHRVSGQHGAGSPSPECTFGTLPPGGNGGGGAGGSFGGRGGDGGGATARGIAGTPTVPTEIRGGCPGQRGASLGGVSVSQFGAGGGAIYLIANESITITGTINASGAGASATGFSGGGTGLGGGGGGSGGMIGLDAAILDISGRVFANGGGGAGGTGGGGGNGGSFGQDPSAPLVAAPGGIANNNAGPGGAGAASTTLDGQVGFNGAGGGHGGGGGGAGVIRVFGTMTGVNNSISPPPS
jgi:hypothetical protein